MLVPLGYLAPVLGAWGTEEDVEPLLEDARQLDREVSQNLYLARARPLIARCDDVNVGLSHFIANSDDLSVRDGSLDVNSDYTGFWNELRVNISLLSGVRTGLKCIGVRWGGYNNGFYW